MALSTDGIMGEIGGIDKRPAAMLNSEKSLANSSETFGTSPIDLDLVAVKGGCFKKGWGLMMTRARKQKSCVNDFHWQV